MNLTNYFKKQGRNTPSKNIISNWLYNELDSSLNVLTDKAIDVNLGVLIHSEKAKRIIDIGKEIFPEDYRFKEREGYLYKLQKKLSLYN